MPPRMTKEEKELAKIKREWEAAKVVYEEALQEFQEVLEEVPQDGNKIGTMVEAFQDDLGDFLAIFKRLNAILLEVTGREAEHQDSVKAAAKVRRDAKRLMALAKQSFETGEDDAASVRSVASDSGDSRSRRKLPKLNLPKFSGEVRDWLAFWSQFQEIHADTSIPAIDKFHYFIQCMEQDSLAKTIVLSYPVTSGNYQLALESVKERYTDNMLIKVYVRDLIKLVIENAVEKQRLDFSTLYVQLSSQLRALGSLGVTTEKCATIIYPIVECCLPIDILRAWQRDPNYTINDDSEEELRSLMSFLQREVRGEDNIKLASEGLGKGLSLQDNKKMAYLRSTNVPTAAGLLTAEVTTNNGRECIFCNNMHPSTVCRKASGMTMEEKKNKIMDKRRCFICLGFGHMARRCRSSISCVNCAGRHAVVMCPNLLKNHSPAKGNRENEVKEDSGEENASTSLTNQTSTEILLQTLKVKVRHDGKAYILRALIDTGSQKSYIAKDVVKQLNLTQVGTEEVIHALFGGYQSQVQIHHKYKVFLSNLDGTYGCNFEVSDIDTISGGIKSVPPGPWIQQLETRGVKLTDIGVTAEKVDLLIGADVAGRLYTGRRLQLECGAVAVHTLLGWTLMGKIHRNKCRNKGDTKLKTASYLSISMLNQIAVSALHVGESPIEKLWNLDSLGIRDPTETQGPTERAEEAMKHFIATVKINEESRVEVELPWLTNRTYLPNNKWIAEKRLITTTSRLIQDGTLEAYDNLFRLWEDLGIIEEVSTTVETDYGHYLPHRAVYNASSVTTPIRPVFDASCKQKGKFSLNDCLEKGPNLLEEIPTILTKFRLQKFGVLADIEKAFQQISVTQEDRDSMKFLWWRCLDQKEMKVYRHRRVVFGINSSPFLLAATLKYLLQQAPEHFQSTANKLEESLYVDNVVAAVKSMDEANRFKEESTMLLSTAQFQLRGWEIGPSDDDRDVSLLGLHWNLKSDEIFCAIGKTESHGKITRREILSTANSVYDPIGFTVPFLVNIKIILQDSWKLRIGWDSEVPIGIKEQYTRWREQLHLLPGIRIPRLASIADPSHSEWTLHVFVDGSKLAYAAVVFLRVTQGDKVSVQLLQAKSRVAPLHKVTIPRLELLACLIGARLATSVKKMLNHDKIDTYFYTDSSTALHWILNDGNWGVFVRNRVLEIRTHSNISNWSHIPGEFNPADLPSRGCTLLQLQKSRWWEGPPWMKLDPYNWPKSTAGEDQVEINEERTKITIASLNTVREEDASMYSELCKLPDFDSMIEHYRNKNSEVKSSEDCEQRILKIVQEIKLRTDKGTLKKFQTFQDDKGIVKIRSRLSFGNFNDSFIYPILLPSDCRIVEALVMRSHRENSHGGVQFLLSKLREHYWIVRGRRVIRKAIGKCPNCQRFDAKKCVPMPASLPSDRIEATNPFEVTGVDLCGPMLLKNRQKVWIVLFTCAVFRAVHLELVTTLSTAGFKSSLRRFVNRRGKPKVIFSDNGTNFVGCSNEMKKVDWTKVEESSPGREIKWKFIPPAAPWWGGWWERMVGVIKNILRRVMGQAVLNQQELQTLLTDVEAVVNQRPLTYVSENPEDLAPLTPAMFLTGNRDSIIPELEQVDGRGLNRRLHYLQRMREDLRTRFKNEYIGQLDNLKQGKAARSLKVGDVVLVEQDNCKRVLWPLARVTEIHPGKDGEVRVVKVRTSDGEFVRPVQRIYPLEVEDGFKSALEIPKSFSALDGCSVMYECQ